MFFGYANLKTEFSSFDFKAFTYGIEISKLRKGEKRGKTKFKIIKLRFLLFGDPCKLITWTIPWVFNISFIIFFFFFSNNPSENYLESWSRFSVSHWFEAVFFFLPFFFQIKEVRRLEKIVRATRKDALAKSDKEFFFCRAVIHKWNPQGSEFLSGGYSRSFIPLSTFCPLAIWDESRQDTWDFP